MPRRAIPRHTTTDPPRPPIPPHHVKTIDRQLRRPRWAQPGAGLHALSRLAPAVPRRVRSPPPLPAPAAPAGRGGPADAADGPDLAGAPPALPPHRGAPCVVLGCVLFHVTCVVESIDSRATPNTTQEVRKTLIVAHVRLGEEAAADGDGDDPPEAAAMEDEEEEEEEDAEAAREMARWYSGLCLYEVAVTPWRAGTPLARMGKGRGEAAQLKHPGAAAAAAAAAVAAGAAGTGAGEGVGGGGGGGGGGGEGEGGPSQKRARGSDGGEQDQLLPAAVAAADTPAKEV